MDWILVAAGSVLGGSARYASSLAMPRFGGSSAATTVFVNLLGCFLAGLLAGLLARPLSQNARLFLLVGFCGSFTTFSAFSLETLNLLESGQGGKALLIAFVSIALGLALTRAGLSAGRLF